VLVGLAAPVLLGLSLDSTSSEVAYTDGSYTVTVKESSSWMDNEPLPAELELYRSCKLPYMTSRLEIDKNADY
jgi:hypothetical protein